MLLLLIVLFVGYYYYYYYCNLVMLLTLLLPLCIYIIVIIMLFKCKNITRKAYITLWGWGLELESNNSRNRCNDLINHYEIKSKFKINLCWCRWWSQMWYPSVLVIKHMNKQFKDAADILQFGSVSPYGLPQWRETLTLGDGSGSLI